jgi:hypothetical protein
MTLEADNVSTLDAIIQLGERSTALVETRIGQHLQASAFRLQIVENQLVAVFTLSIEAT